MNNPYVNLIRAIWHHGKPWRPSIIIYYCAFIIAQTFLSLSPYALGKTIDILQHFKPNRLYEVIAWLSVSVIVLFLFWLFHGPARVLERQVALKIQQTLRTDLYEKLTQLPLKWHQYHHSGNIITRINRAATALFRFASDQFLYIETIIKFLTSSLFLLWLSWPIGILSFLSCSLAIATVLVFDRILVPLYNRENEIDNHVGAVLFDYISNMTTIITLRLGELTRNNLFQRMMAIWPFYKKEAILNEVKWFTIGMILTTLQAIILIGYIVHSLNTTGAVLIGMVVMIFRYQGELNEVFYNFSAHYSELVKMDTEVQGLQPVLNDIKNLVHVSQNTILIDNWRTISIHELDFYHGGEKENKSVFNRLSLTIRRGEKIALIGLSGGGKSTLLNIIRGIYKPDHARLIIDGITFNSLEPLQAITTLIPQDPEIFENTVGFNIAMDVAEQQEEINHAIELSGFAKVLTSLPLGLGTHIAEKGLNLSVGQKQRLALARGLFAARFSSLILMDEPTSSVDLQTEKEIMTGIIETFPDAAVIVSLHRLHLLSKFDRIIMLDHGKIIADGLSAELLRQPGTVRELWQSYQATMI